MDKKINFFLFLGWLFAFLGAWIFSEPKLIFLGVGIFLLWILTRHFIREIQKLQRAIFLADRDTKFIKKLREKNSDKILWRKIKRSHVYWSLKKAAWFGGQNLTQDPFHVDEL
ncbi:hypothetical protein HN954_00285 [bacterium]|jgi:predicted tellurium resistance membrane protein TerC|nr:hypothetical protein [bacterium]MBT6832071.1 hypothetical protein [bacterium]MBT6995852.1 hypothetical protein [bacterium]MBT7772623.1 hypothetical protein [bacterium]